MTSDFEMRAVAFREEVLLPKDLHDNFPSAIFAPKFGDYLNDQQFFIFRFQCIPNVIVMEGIDCKKANSWFVQKHKDIIKDSFHKRVTAPRTNRMELEDAFYILYEDLLVSIDFSISRVSLLYKQTENKVVEALIIDLRKFKKNIAAEKNHLLMLVDNSDGMLSKSLPINKPKLKIVDNYNADFLSIHEVILKRLRSKNDRGLVLLHGKPGTGKTSYIRYLIGSIKKNVIFIPPAMASHITSPSLMTMLIKNPNNVFVIEDAENIVMDRESNGNSPVSALLNITDGLLADSLNIQVICTFNTDISKIDSALLRKGRLIAKYEFKALEIEKAQKLSDKLGFKSIIKKPMTLASIYNQDDMDFQENNGRKMVGFAK